MDNKYKILRMLQIFFLIILVVSAVSKYKLPLLGSIILAIIVLVIEAYIYKKYKKG